MFNDTYFMDFLINKARWSLDTFGTGARTKGLTEHIRKELLEIEEAPEDLLEWIDVFMLATDGFWRAYTAHHTSEEEITYDVLERAAEKFCYLMMYKDNLNRSRKWPKPTSQDHCNEHIKE